MGVIARQSSKAAIVTYIGVVLGLVNQVLIYPLALSLDQLGELQFMIQTASMFPPFLLLGLTSVLTKYYRGYSSDEETKQTFYGAIFLAVTFNVLLFLGLFLVFDDQIISHYNDASGASALVVYITIGLAILFSYGTLATTVSAVHARVAVPNLLSQIIKVVLPVLALSFYFEWISFQEVLVALFIYYVILTVILIIYTLGRDTIRPKLSLSTIKEKLEVRPMLIFAGFSLLSGIGASLTNKIDVVMITALIGTYQTGLYSWGLFIANALAIPYVMIASISTPIIAEHWQNNDKEAIDKLYKSSSSSILVLALLAFFSVWLALDHLFLLMPKGDEFRLAKPMVLLLGIAAIVDMASGVNGHILSMSGKYRMLLIFLVFTALINVGLNWVLIPKYGIEGSGIATVVSIVFFNLCKYFYLRKHYGFNPFTNKTIQILLVGVLTYSLVVFVPQTSTTWINLLLYPTLFASIFAFSTYKLRLAPEINIFVNKQLLRLNLISFD